MGQSGKYKAISVTVPVGMERALAEVCRKEIRKKSEVVQEALRLYFRARSGKVEPLALVMPSSDDECKHADQAAFAPEWRSSLDSVYDNLGR